MGAPDINWNTSRPPDVKYQPRKLRHAQRAANLFQRNYSISTPELVCAWRSWRQRRKDWSREWGIIANVYMVYRPQIVTLTNFILLRPIYFNLFFQESILFLFKWGSQGENMSGTLMFLKRRKAIALHGTPSSLEFRAEKELKNPFRPFKIVFELWLTSVLKILQLKRSELSKIGWDKSLQDSCQLIRTCVPFQQWVATIQIHLCTYVNNAINGRHCNSTRREQTSKIFWAW